MGNSTVSTTASTQASSPPGFAVQCAILTVSSAASQETDANAQAAAALLKAMGHHVLFCARVPDDRAAIRGALLDAVEQGSVEVLLITGGTGIAPTDVTPEAIEPLFVKQLPGFGELFRHLSFVDIGPRALLSHATAGIVGRTLVFAVPGQPAAVRLVVEKLLGPVLCHAVGLMRGQAVPLQRQAP